MGVFDHFPYTNFHELNLDWILKQYTELTAKVTILQQWMTTHKTEYQEAMTRLAAVENEIDTFEQQVQDEFDRLKAEIDADFAAQKAALEALITDTQDEIEREILQMREDVDAAIAGFQNQFIQLKASIINEIEDLKAEVRREVNNFYNVMLANNEYVFQHVENRLDEFIASFPTEVTVYVYNPYRGEVTDIQQAIYDLYEVACIWGLTATQYDSLGLTATQYDALDLTAQQYDTMGYKLLYPDPDTYMLSPFTGEYVKVQAVVSQLAMFHMDGLTAEEYDTEDLTAEAYDTLDITAFNYDWFGKQLIA